MAAAEVASRPQERTNRRRPFANFVKRLAHFKGHSESQEKTTNGKKLGSNKSRKNTLPASGKSAVYPESGHIPVRPQASQPSFSAASQSQYENRNSYSSLPDDLTGKGASGNGARNAAPTVATNAETMHSDAGQSKPTATTGYRALSSIDDTRGDSTFSSPNHSERSLATTLTTLQSTTLQHGPGGASSQPMGSMFSHQFPTSPIQATPATASAIPRHMTASENIPATYSSATAGGVLSDNASILTLASSSKRRRRSMDTDASVRAMAPSSVWGGSRESLPLSVLSGQAGPATGPFGSASAERASVYSMSYRDSMGVTSPALVSERNSYYAKQAGADAKSLRSISNLRDDARSLHTADARSVHDVASLRSIAPSEARHARNDSIPGSVSASAGPSTAAPSLLRQASAGGTILSLSRRSSDWRPVDDEDEDEDEEEDAADGKEGRANVEAVKA